MNWIDRYIIAVERYLPNAERDDIGEELRSILEEKLQDAAEASGVEPDEAQVLGLLKEFGHPLQVASSYRSQRPFISGELMPLYKQAIKFLVLGYLAFAVAAGVVSISGVFDWWPADMGDTIGNVFFMWFICISTGFYFFDRYMTKADLFGRWDPARLRALDSAGPPILLSESIATLIAGLIVFAILTAIDSTLTWTALGGRTDNPWVPIFLWARLQVVLQMLLHGYALFRPHWSRPKLAFNAVSDLFLSFIALRAILIDSVWPQLLPVIWILLIAGLIGAFSSLRRIKKPAAMYEKNWFERYMHRRVNPHAERAADQVDQALEKAANRIEDKRG